MFVFGRLAVHVVDLASIINPLPGRPNSRRQNYDNFFSRFAFPRFEGIPVLGNLQKEKNEEQSK
jgi:hypothetical protein